MAAGHSSRNDTLTKGQADRLPFPLGLYWLRAQQATRPADVYKAAEAVVRVLAAPLLADVLGSEWPAELEKMLRGEGSGRPPLEAPGFGTRISLLRLLVKAHAGVSAPLLAGVQEWWAAVDGEQGPLNRLVQGRNGEAHGAAHGSESQWKVEKAQALGLLGTVLRGASFLRETQWVHLDGDAAQRRGKMVGKLWRLDGTGPYGMLPKDAEWPPSFALERDFVYLGSADGTTWKLMPFVLLHDGTVGHPLPVVLDTIDRRGRLKFLEPVSGKEVERALPGEDWAETTWTAFLDNRRALAEAWALRLEAPHAGFAVKVEADLADGLKPGAVLEDYRLVQKLGEGGAAVVWEAEDVHDGTSCALKVLKGEMAANETEVSRFEEEIRRLKKLANDGCRRVVKPVFSFRVQHGDTRRVVLRMPLYKGTLKEHAANLRATSGNAPPSEKELASWARMALEALAELHARGVVHRDVKSSNFLLNDAGELVISDFGIAREEASRAGLTKTGDLLGTQLYMAPEQLRSAKTVTAAADMYALAVSLDELWSGEPRVTPGKGMEGTLGELLRAMSSQDPEARPTAAQALEKLGGVAVSAPAARGVTGSHPVVSAPVAATPASPGALAEWRELFWWLNRTGQLKVLDPKALEVSQRELGLGAGEVDALRGAYRRDANLLQQALAEAAEDGMLEGHELVALEQVRVDACISQREAEEFARAALGAVGGPLGEKAPGWVARGWEAARAAVQAAQDAAPQWYAAVGGAQLGPMDEQALLALVEKGEVTAETLVWRTGMAEWCWASEVSELATRCEEVLQKRNRRAAKPVRSEPGMFWMGAPADDEQAGDQERPAHPVVITRPFAFWNVPVTQSQYQSLMGENPSLGNKRGDMPVTFVSWFEAIRYCNALSVKHGLAPAYTLVETDDFDRPTVYWKGLDAPG